MNYQPSILVIDDEKNICESCNRIFSLAGYKVDTNVNATNGFRQALMNNYDAIILDLKLGETDGMQILNGIREKKPNVPVVIITGYPSEESKRMSMTLGISDYIIKPFEPAEILESIQKVTDINTETQRQETGIQKDEVTETHYHFYLFSWFHRGPKGLIRVGGHLPNLLNNTIESITLPDIGSIIYRGLPLAEVILSNKTKEIIPSPICGKITKINTNLKKYPYRLEKNINRKNWMAIVEPENLEEDLKNSETRKVLMLTENISEENYYFNQFIHKGYITKIISSIDEVIKILAEKEIKVVVIDAIKLLNYGPEYAKRINQKFPDTKIIVFNGPNLEIENLYRENKIFYYGVSPISNNEMDDLLYCAFYDKKRYEVLKPTYESGFLPNTISKIHITNRYGKKISLYAFNDILQNNSGIGNILIKELLDLAYPLEVNHTRFFKSIDETAEIQNITSEKEKCDRIIMLHTKNINKIPGSLIKDIQEYENYDGCDKKIITLSIQPGTNENEEISFNDVTTISLVEIILNEMISK